MFEQNASEPACDPEDLEAPRRLRVVISTDAANEADDQYAIVHALLSPPIEVRGIVPTHFGDQRTRHSLQESRAEVDLLLELMNLSRQVVVADGAPHALRDTETPIDTAGARLIIQEARAADRGTLFVPCLGPLTDMASAILLDPSIVDRDVVVIWIGGDPYGDQAAPYRPEFNLMNDVNAANVVFDSGIPLWQVPSSTYMQCAVSYPELRRRVRPCGRLGRYLYDQLVAFGTSTHPTAIDRHNLGDSSAIGLILNPLGAVWREQPRVRFTSDGHHEESGVDGVIRVCEQIDNRFLLEDFFHKLEEGHTSMPTGVTSRSGKTTPPMFYDTPPRPPFDPELVPALEEFQKIRPPLSESNLLEHRQFDVDGLPGADPVDLTALERAVVEEHIASGPDGAPDVALLVLRPAAGAGPWPAIYYVHGGGMVTGNRRSGVDTLLPYVVELGAVIVSVEYRLAPEHPDPAPVEDCYAGLVWTAKNAERLSIDPARVMIAGGSAGGGLAAGTALLARDRGFPHLTHQMLMCPMLDDRLETVSSRMLDGEGFWDRNENLFGWTALLGDRRGGPEVSPYAAPARATDFAGLPRTYIDIGSADTFRDEAVAFAQRLSEAGVSVDLHLWAGGYHGFEWLAPGAAVSQTANAVRDEFVRRALTP